MGDDFVGKLLIRKIPAKDQKLLEGKDKAREEDSQASPEKDAESGDDN
jgi:hypothetical protein